MVSNIFTKLWCLLATISTLAFRTGGASSVNLVLSIDSSFYDQSNNRLQSSDSEIKQVAAALQAIKDVNDGNGSRVPALQDYQSRCPVKLNFTVLDIGTSFSGAIRQYNNYKTTVGLPQAIVGTPRSSSTIPLSFVSSSDEVPMIGFAATSTSLDDEGSHPYYSRTINSDDSLAGAVAALVKHYEYRQVAILYNDDAYGRSLKDAMFNKLSIEQIGTPFFSFESQNQASIDNALERLKLTKLNVVISIIFTEDMEYTMVKALELGLAGKDKLWIFTDSISSTEVLEYSNTNEAFAKAIKGNVRIISVPFESPSQSQFQTEFSSFDVIDLLREKLPGGGDSLDILTPSFAANISDDFLASGPSEYNEYIFDAIVTFALIIEQRCSNITGPPGRIDANEWQNLIRDGNINFTGVSGDVEFLPSGSRNPSTLDFPLFVFEQASEGNTMKLSRRGNFLFENSVWNIDSDVTYSTGNAIPPLFTDLPTENENDIEQLQYLVSWIIASIVVLAALLLMLWTYMHVNEPVIRAAQPEFLYTTLIGVIISTISIFFATSDFAGLDFRCRGNWWLISVGLTITATALSLKLYRINRVFNNSSLKKITLSVKKMLLVMAFVLLINVALLSIWSFTVPYEYSKRVVTEDEFGQPTESYYWCEAQIANNYAEPLFWGVLILFHLSQYVAGGYLAFKTRNIPSDFQEGSWIAIAVFSQAQLIAFGVPVVISIDEKENGLRYMLSSVLLCIVNAALIGLLFYPKFARLRFNIGFNTCLIQCGLRDESRATRVAVMVPQVTPPSPDYINRSSKRLNRFTTNSKSSNEIAKRLNLSEDSAKRLNLSEDSNSSAI